jgi:uncharacterized membrane protein YidH (DUF202 family)
VGLALVKIERGFHLQQMCMHVSHEIQSSTTLPVEKQQIRLSLSLVLVQLGKLAVMRRKRRGRNKRREVGSALPIRVLASLGMSVVYE